MRIALTKAGSKSGPTSSSKTTVTTRSTTARNHRQNLPAGVMWANSRGMLLDRVTSLRQANIYEPQSYRHILGQPLIE